MPSARTRPYTLATCLPRLRLLVLACALAQPALVLQSESRQCYSFGHPLHARSSASYRAPAQCSAVAVSGRASVALTTAREPAVLQLLQVRPQPRRLAHLDSSHLEFIPGACPSIARPRAPATFFSGRLSGPPPPRLTFRLCRDGYQPEINPTLHPLLTPTINTSYTPDLTPTSTGIDAQTPERATPANSPGFHTSESSSESFSVPHQRTLITNHTKSHGSRESHEPLARKGTVGTARTACKAKGCAAHVYIWTIDASR